MALAITENFRMDAGGKEFRFCTVVHDGTVLVISAPLVDLDRIDFVAQLGTIYLSDVASSGSEVMLSLIAEGAVIDMRAAATVLTGSKTRMMIVGW